MNVSAAVHLGGGSRLATPEGRANFLAMASNRLADKIDETWVNDVGPLFVAKLAEAVAGEWTQANVIEALRAQFARYETPIKEEDKARIELIVNRAFELAVNGKIEYKPHPYANGLKGDGYRDFEGAALTFFSRPQPHLKEGNAPHNAQVQNLFGYFGDRIYNAGLSWSPATKENIPELVKEVAQYTDGYLDPKVAQDYAAHLAAAYDKIYSRYPTELPYVNIDADPRGILYRMPKREEWERY